MELEIPKTPEPLDNTTLKKSTFGRGRPRLIRDRLSPNSSQNNATTTPILGDSTGPLTIINAHMTDAEIDRAIEDAKCADQECFYPRRKRLGVY